MNNGTSESEPAAAHGTGGAPAGSVTDHVQQALRMDVELEAAERWPIASSRFSATARASTALGTVSGFGSGGSADEARRRAIMECAERYAQFGRDDPPLARVDPYASVTHAAIAPTVCGLYSSAQYAAPGFGFAPFSEQAPLDWLELSDLVDGSRRLLPVEFMYPRAALTRRPLVAETSSGTAAHVDHASATLAAVCEVIERDSVMLFWYRQPSTTAIPVDAIPAPDLRDELRSVQQLGFVVTVCRLVYDLAVPCYLIIALQGDAFAYGVGCHPDWRSALRHGLTELGRLLLWLQQGSPSAVVYQSLTGVRTPTDHYALYNRGPLHDVLRQALRQTLRSASPEDWPLAQAPASDEQALAVVLDTLAARGYRTYTCDLTPPVLASSGVKVVRALVPGLVPIHFGYDRMRLGCRRLWSGAAPGRLSTLLPHFMG